MKAIRKQSPSKKANELASLRSEVALLRSFVIGTAGRDTEGMYRPEFVRRIQQAAQEIPVEEFTDTEEFLSLLSQKN